MFLVARGDDDGETNCDVRLSGRTSGNIVDEEEAGREPGSAEEGGYDHDFPFALCSIIIRATCWPLSVTMGIPAPGLTLPPTKNRLWNWGLRFGALKAKLRRRSQTTP